MIRTAEQARARGAKGAGKVRESLIEGMKNLDTGEDAPATTSSCFPNMKAAAYSLGISIAVLKDARARDCPAFRSGAMINREQLITWLKQQSLLKKTVLPPPPMEDEEDDYSTAVDEKGGVGLTLRSLQAYERKLKRMLDDLHQSNQFTIKEEKEAAIKAAEAAWLKVAGQLLKYDLAVDEAKRESGELISLADAKAGVQALLAWHTVATSDALRNVIPSLEGKNKFQIATLLDPALRSAIYRNFKLGAKLGKIPDWMSATASEFVKVEKEFSMNPDDY